MPLIFADVSSHQWDNGAVDLPALVRAVAAVLVKATEGLDYVNPYLSAVLAEARGQGKPCGTYHFSRGGDPVAEAEFYLAHADHRPGEVLCDDFEIGVADPDGWNAAFLGHLIDRTGVHPWLYLSESVATARPWTATRACDVALWDAAYRANTGQRPAGGVNAGPWGQPAAWQWTSNGREPGLPGVVDLSDFYGDAAAWRAYGGIGAVPPAPAPVPAPAPGPVNFDLHFGQTSAAVAHLQLFLALNYPAYAGQHGALLVGPGGTATGYYGAITAAWVHEFAHRSGITADTDGHDVGPLISAALQRAGFHG